MVSDERTKLVAPCGIDCGICEMYLCKDNEQLYNYLLSRGIPKDKIPCKGCKNVQGDCPVIGQKCETYICATNKKVDYCFECSNFPCDKFNPAADKAETLPHNIKVFNLCKIEKDGIEEFINKSLQIKQKYYKGKMEIGKGPKLDK